MLAGHGQAAVARMKGCRQHRLLRLVIGGMLMMMMMVRVVGSWMATAAAAVVSARRITKAGTQYIRLTQALLILIDQLLLVFGNICERNGKAKLSY